MQIRKRPFLELSDLHTSVLILSHRNRALWNVLGPLSLCAALHSPKCAPYPWIGTVSWDGRHHQMAEKSLSWSEHLQQVWIPTWSERTSLINKTVDHVTTWVGWIKRPAATSNLYGSVLTPVIFAVQTDWVTSSFQLRQSGFIRKWCDHLTILLSWQPCLKFFPSQAQEGSADTIIKAIKRQWRVCFTFTFIFSPQIQMMRSVSYVDCNQRLAGRLPDLKDDGTIRFRTRTKPAMLITKGGKDNFKGLTPPLAHGSRSPLEKMILLAVERAKNEHE